MVGLGTVINVGAIVVGGLIGLLFGSRVSQRMQASLTAACGVAVIAIGLAGAMAGMLSVSDERLVSGQAMLVVVSLVIGGILGELLDLHGGITRAGAWLRNRTGNASDKGFVDAFVTASVTVCVGAMAVVGSIADGISGDWSILAVKAALDFVIIAAMSASLGRGAVFSALPVGIFQGVITAAAVGLKPLMTQPALDNLSLVGSLLIACVGINLLWPGRITVANLLPAILVAPAIAFLPLG